MITWKLETSTTDLPISDRARTVRRIMGQAAEKLLDAGVHVNWVETVLPVEDEVQP